MGKGRGRVCTWVHYECPVVEGVLALSERPQGGWSGWNREGDGRPVERGQSIREQTDYAQHFRPW